MQHENTRVIVVGAGYAGTIAANRLAKKAATTQITVINPREDFVERVRLHEQIAGTGAAATPLEHMLRDGIATRIGTVDTIGDGAVALTDGDDLGFDYLFLAVGSTAAALPGTIPVGTWEGAQQARVCLSELPADGVVTVVGGGLTGVETASEIAEARPDLHVRLVAETIAASLSPRARNRTRAALTRLKVEIIEDAVTAVRHGSGAARGAVHLRSSASLDSDLTLWAIASAVPDLAGRSGLDVDGRGRAVVDEFLRSTGDRRIFVIGDCAAVPGARPSCATAAPQGAHAADTLLRILAGKRPEPYSMGYTGQAVSLGRRNGLLQLSRRDDTARNLYYSGRAAAVTKETVCRYAKYGARTANYAWLPGR